jgi:hypothetical protein
LSGPLLIVGVAPFSLSLNNEAKTSKLYEEIGRLKIEVDWLKKKSEQISKM